MEPAVADRAEGDTVVVDGTTGDGTYPATADGRPGDALRALPVEAEQRGTRFVSAQAVQARLFSVYDAAAAAEEALALVQDQLTLTLNRSYYGADELDELADRLDSLLGTGGSPVA
jgi:hypothetical protein